MGMADRRRGRRRPGRAAGGSGGSSAADGRRVPGSDPSRQRLGLSSAATRGVRRSIRRTACPPGWVARSSIRMLLADAAGGNHRASGRRPRGGPAPVVTVAAPGPERPFDR